VDPYRGEEVILQYQPNLFRWVGAKAGLSMFGTKLGTVVITSRRFLFVSSGRHGLEGQFDVLLGQTRVDTVDLSALGHEGSIDLPLTRVRLLDVKRRWDLASYLSLRGVREDGSDLAFSFMSKLGLNRGDFVRLSEAFAKAKSVADI
jgi:hypothetical protein